MRIWPLVILGALLALIGVSGCGATTGGTGYGADGGQWPQSPSRAPLGAAGKTKAEEPPRVPLTVTLRLTAPEEVALALDIEKVELKTEKSWVPVAVRPVIEGFNALPVRAGKTAAIALLYTGAIAKRPYTQARLTLRAATTRYTHGDTALPLALESTTVTFSEWTPAADKPNLLAIAVDGAQVGVTETRATLPAAAFTASTALPTGGITGMLDPPTANAIIDLYWGAGKVKFRSVPPPDGQTGLFTIADLPAGAYRLELRTPGRTLIEPLKELIAVDTKLVKLPRLALTTDTGR